MAATAARYEGRASASAIAAKLSMPGSDQNLAVRSPLEVAYTNYCFFQQRLLFLGETSRTWPAG